MTLTPAEAVLLTRLLVAYRADVEEASPRARNAAVDAIPGMQTVDQLRAMVDALGARLLAVATGKER